MHFNCFTVCSIAIVFAQAFLTTPAKGQLQSTFQRHSEVIKTRLLNANSSFEDGFVGWNDRQIPADLLTRDWTPGLGPVPFEEYGNLGAKLVKITEQGQWGQILALSTAKEHVLNLHAYRQSINGSTTAPFAAAYVSYYDASFKLLDTVEVLIGDRNQNAFPLGDRGIGDNLNFYSLGIDVPQGSAYAHMYIQNSSDTEVYADAFGLFEYTQSKTSSVTKNLIRNPRFARYFNPFIDLKGAQGLRTEFWSVDTEWTRGLSPEFNLPFFGSIAQTESAFQKVALLPNRTYTLRFEGYFPQYTPAAVGVDFFDASWNKLGGRRMDTSEGPETFHHLLRIETPANMVYAQAFLWCDKFDPRDTLLLYGNLSLQLHATNISRSTSVILADAFPKLTPKFNQRVGSDFVVVFSDADGIDVSSLGTSDAYFQSRTNKAKTYPATVSDIQTSLDGSTVRVVYTIFTGYADVSSMVIRRNEVKDRLGNYAPTKTFSTVGIP